MPVRRTPDGKIIEEKTQIQRPGSTSSEGPTTVDPASRRQPPSQPTEGSRFNAQTVVVSQDPGQDSGADNTTDQSTSSAASTPAVSGDDKGTRLVGIGTSSKNEQETGAGATAFKDEPVTGWLVVVKGPGRGRFAPIGMGRNPVGRSPQARVSLNFGDDTISRDAHIVISYDHKGRQFYLQPGEGQNLSYLNDTPVLNTEELEPGAVIVLGETEVKFVAFCGEDFDWSDSAD